MTTRAIPTVTKEIAMNAKNGDIFYNRTLKQGPKGNRMALHVRVSGKCQTWVRRANNFRLPVKHGLYQSWSIDQNNCHEWLTQDPTK